MAATWTTHRERGNPALLRFFVWLALTLGRPLARLILHGIVVYFVFAGGAARAASRDYMKRVLGREPTPMDGYRHVHCFASTILDRAYLLNDRHDLFRIRVIGKEIGTGAMEGRRMADGSLKRGAFLFGAHVGSFESIRAAGHKQSDLNVWMVMYEDNAQVLNQVLEAINPKMARTIIPLGRVDSMLHVKRALDDGGFVGMLADRTLAEEEGTSAVRRMTVLGSPTSIPTGPFRMAAMLRRPALFIIGLYRGGNRYDVHYEELYDFSTLDEVPREERAARMAAAIDEAMDRYVARLEHFCRDAPYNWFNFFDYWNDAAQPGTHQADRRDGKAR